MTIWTLHETTAELSRQVERLEAAIDGYKRGILDFDELSRIAGNLLVKIRRTAETETHEPAIVYRKSAA